VIFVGGAHALFLLRVVVARQRQEDNERSISSGSGS
jgi:hypothetical protein